MNSCRAAFITGVLGLSLLTPLALHAANLPYSLSVTPFTGEYIFEGNQQRQNKPLHGLSVGYNFSEHWTLEVTGSGILDSTMITPSGSAAPTQQKWNIYGVRGDVLYHFFPEFRYVPYLAAGGGGMILVPRQGTSGHETMIEYGGGVKFYLTDYLALRADVRHILDFTNSIFQSPRKVHNNLAYTAGLTFQIGGLQPAIGAVREEKPALMAEAPPPAPAMKEPPAVPAPPERSVPLSPVILSPTADPAPKMAEAVIPPVAPPAAASVAPVVAPVAPAPREARKKTVVREIKAVGDGLEILTGGDVGYFKVFTLSKPARLVIDITGAESGLGAKMLPINRLGIAVVRTGSYPDYLRIVLDASGKKLPDYQVIQTEKGLKVKLTR